MVTEQARSLDETTRKAFVPISSVCVGGGFPTLPRPSLVLAECPTIYINCDSIYSGGSDSKESACNVGDLDSVPVLGRSPGVEMANQSCILAWEITWTEGTCRL